MKEWVFEIVEHQHIHISNQSIVPVKCINYGYCIKKPNQQKTKRNNMHTYPWHFVKYQKKARRKSSHF